jgi:hypothetical protein
MRSRREAVCHISALAIISSLPPLWRHIGEIERCLPGHDILGELLHSVDLIMRPERVFGKQQDFDVPYVHRSGAGR